MVKLIIKPYAVYLIFLAVSAAWGVHVHPARASAGPQIILPWSEANRNLDHRQLPEPEKTLLEYVLRESVNPDSGLSAIPPVAFALTLLQPLPKANITRFSFELNPQYNFNPVSYQPLHRRPPPG